jgi:hypothetical protein
VRVLTQLLGSWHHAVTYLSKQLDAVSWGWPPCLHALAATTILVAEAGKLTLVQELTVWVLHSVLTLIEYKGNYWLTNSQMVRYQSMLCKNPCIQLEVVKTLNLATLLPVDSGSLKHDCLQVMDEVFFSWPELTDLPQSSRHWVFHRWQQFWPGWHMFCWICNSDSGCCHWSTSSASPLCTKSSVHCCYMGASAYCRSVENIYMTSKYAFTTIHVHGALYKERGFINLGGKKC